MPAAPSTDPGVRDYRTGLLPRVMTARRSLGQGWQILAGGSQRSISRRIRSQVVRCFWLRRRSARSHSQPTRWRNTAIAGPLS